MSDEQPKELLTQLNQRLLELHIAFETLAKATSDQQIFLIRMLATQASNFAVLRALLVEDEKQDRAISEELKKGFHFAIAEFQSQLEAYHASHDPVKFLNSFVMIDPEPESPPPPTNLN